MKIVFTAVKSSAIFTEIPRKFPLTKLKGICQSLCHLPVASGVVKNNNNNKKQNWVILLLNSQALVCKEFSSCAT